MLEQFLAVANAVLTRKHTNTLRCVAIFSVKKLFTTASVTLCSQSAGTTSTHSICMMHTLMLD
jgi:hypothetical protein